MNNSIKSSQTFDEWFDSLTEEKQREYIEEMEADYWIDYYKSFPKEYEY